MDTLPKIRIKYGRFLDLLVRPNFPDYPDQFKIESKIADYKNIWKNYENQILTSICDVLKLSFKQNIIDVYIVGKGRPFSDPMVISINFSDDEFIDVLTHELLHRLISDNNLPEPGAIRKKWVTLYQGEEELTLNHILVHAVSQYIYLDILKEPARLDRDIEKCKTNPPYARAWEIVMQKGYKQIIQEFINEAEISKEYV